MSNSTATTYPLLQEILGIKNLPLQPTYTIRDLARLLTVSVRTIQNRVASGQIHARDLPGRAKFLPQEIEQFLSAGKKVRARRAS